MKIRVEHKINSLFDLYCQLKDNTIYNRVIDFLAYTNDYISEEDREAFEKVLQGMFPENNLTTYNEIAHILEVLLERCERFFRYGNDKKGESKTED